MSIPSLVSIIFACTAANHLGLVQAIESVIHKRLPVINCVKCFTFWSTLAYGLTVNSNSVAATIALSFLAAWLAIWLDLLMGFIDKKYLYLYDTIYPTTNTSDSDTLPADNTLPDVSE